MIKRTSYLSQLRFDESLLRSWQAKVIANIRIVILLIVSIIMLGAVSFFTIPRRLNPEIKIPIVNIVTVLSGSAPQDVEKLVTIPIEESIKDVKGIDTLQSTSAENISVITVQFVSTVNGDKAKDDVQSSVDTVNTLPDDANTPKVTLLDFEDQPFWIFDITTQKDIASLMRFSKKLKENIEKLNKVDRVMMSGLEQQEIQVTIEPQKALDYNISPIQLSQLVKKATSSYPAGMLNTEQSTFSLSIDPIVTTVDDIRNLTLQIHGQSIPIGDVAVIAERSEINQEQTLLGKKGHAPARTVQFMVFKSSSANIDAAEKDVRTLVEKSISDQQNHYKVTSILNTSDQITEQFDDLFGEFRSTIILVFLLLLVFLGLKQALISTLTIPLTFLSAFAIIQQLGMSLNFLTMFAFLLALGLLIDDTIVVVAAMTRYYNSGKFTPYQTGILVWKDFIVPLWSTTITTIWAFVPLLLSTGIIGEFIKPIPIVVTATMLSSTSIAVLITIPLMVVLLKPQLPSRLTTFLKTIAYILLLGFIIFATPQSPVKPLLIMSFIALSVIAYSVRGSITTKILDMYNRQKLFMAFVQKVRAIADKGLISTDWLGAKYAQIIHTILVSKQNRRKTLIAIGAFVIIGYMLVPLGFVKNEFFPKTNQELIYVNVEMPKGTRSEMIKGEMKRLLPELEDTEETEFVVAESGKNIDSQGGRAADQNLFMYTVHLTPKENRTVTSQEIAENVRREFAQYHTGKLTVFEETGGPPAGADVQIKLLGPELSELNTQADRIVDHLQDQKGIIDPQKSVKPGLGKITFVPDTNNLSLYGVGIDQIGFALRTFASGTELDTLGSGDNEKKIVYRASAEQERIQNIYQLSVGTNSGPVPLTELGDFKLLYNPTAITREGGNRTISVTAGVQKGFNIPEKNKELVDFVSKMNLPEGYTWQTGGANEENNKSVQSILKAMLVAGLLILITMVIEFGSYRQAAIALMIIPVSIAGVFYIFALAQIPLSFPALIGVLALFGIVVTHAIVVIEKINDNRKEGIGLIDSIVDAAENRLEPVMLTSLATILGLIPVTLADPLWRGLGGAIIAGLIFSGALKLFFVPVMYYNWFKDDEAKSFTDI